MEPITCEIQPTELPPPPPPIFADKTKGKKTAVEAGLELVCENLPKTAQRGVDRGGGSLWLRSAAGKWHTGPIGVASFQQALSTGSLALVVVTAIDPVEVLIQPGSDGWGQRVELVPAYEALVALAAP